MHRNLSTPIVLSNTLVLLSLFTIFFSLISFSLVAQNRISSYGSAARDQVRYAQEVITDEHANPRFVKFQSGIPFESISSLKNLFYLDESCELSFQSKIKDQIGHEHLRYTQTYNGIEILGADYIFHCNQEMVTSANGNVYKDVSLSTTPTISRKEGLKIAIAEIAAESYMWENEKNQAFLRKESADPNATFYPEAKLFISSKDYQSDNNLVLVYQYDIYASKPLGRYSVEVDAHSGEIINKINRIHHTTTDGSGESLYDGTVDLKMDFDGSKYYLSENSRGAMINTYDMNNGTNYESAILFSQNDNYFEDDASRTGVSAHFGAGATYDYFHENFGRDSYDDSNAAIHSYVHFSSNYFNAFWDGSRMTYGDANGIEATALVCLDIVGHEITHAVTEHSAGLVYSYESGALNESFSDIFGQAVEMEQFPATASWSLGDQIFLDGVSMIRSMNNPNS